MTLSKRDVDHIFDRLRSGVVPERGLEAFAVGIERHRAEVSRMLDLAKNGEGTFKFLRGGYGCGKTFMARATLLDALGKNFAASFVVVSDNDLHFHRFDDVYRKVVEGLATSSCPRGALGDILDRWMGKVEDAVIAGGADEGSPDFDALVQKRMEQDIASRTGGRAPEDFARAVRAVFELKQKGNTQDAAALVSWLSGSDKVPQTIKKLASLKGEITGRDAMDYLHGIVEVVKAAGYEGLVIVIDEAETILRMRSDVRGKSLNGIRQIIDAADRYKGLLWVFTGTPEFFDSPRGVKGLPPLHDRIQFLAHGGVATLKQPQLALTPFDRARLKEVALKLRGMYLDGDRARLEARVSPAFIERLVDSVTEGFKGDVGVVPRQFLRRFVNVLDLVGEDADFDPMAALGFTPAEPNEDERRRLEGRREYDPEPGDEKGYQVQAVEW
ncbi:MAG: BREX system ATP-binding protein BrxD [Polyangiales bacterium]